MKAFDNPRVVFEIGQDYAHYGLSPTETDNAAYMDGYRSSSRRSTLPADRFVKKWLQVRTNAWRRNRHVEPDFSVQLLRDIDRPTCPVSDVAFTYGTGQESDWSVDRIDNNGGYTAGNLVLLTTRVNREKGALTLWQLLMLGSPLASTQLAAFMPPPPSCGSLTDSEWGRLAWFASTQEMHIGYPVKMAFADSVEFEHLNAPWCAKIQQFLVELTRRKASPRATVWKWLESFTPTVEGRRRIHLVREGMNEYGRITAPADRSAFACFADPTRWSNFASWWIYLNETAGLRALLIQISDGLPARVKVNVDEYRTRKQSGTGGYG
ncbi:MAG: hypothetical protein RR983_15535 [Massilia sp.]|jgi:hypothetical protein|uniref:hypothetical protein n=1 Tax=Massilia sp. TaxID=1882437 RepID=UPI002FC5C39D